MKRGYNNEVQEIRSFYIFCCGRDKAYEIIHSRGFPRMTVGRQFLVSPDALQKWINQNHNSDISLR